MNAALREELRLLKEGADDVRRDSSCPPALANPNPPALTPSTKYFIVDLRLY